MKRSTVIAAGFSAGLIAAMPHAAMAAGSEPDFAILGSGPVFLLTALSPVASLCVVLALSRRLDSIASVALKGQERLQETWAAPMAWGLAALVLVLAASAIFFKVKALALLGVALVAVGAVLLGLGLATGALAVGSRLLEAAGDFDRTPIDHLRVGLLTLIVAAICPFVGWIAVGLTGLAGIGAVLEAIVTRDRVS